MRNFLQGLYFRVLVLRLPNLHEHKVLATKKCFTGIELCNLQMSQKCSVECVNRVYNNQLILFTANRLWLDGGF